MDSIESIESPTSMNSMTKEKKEKMRLIAQENWAALALAKEAFALSKSNDGPAKERFLDKLGEATDRVRKEFIPY